jgi:hypothetical protein
MWESYQSEEGETERFGDIISYHNAADVVIDATLTSKTHRTLREALNPNFRANQIEGKKLKSYEARLNFPEHSFTPMGVDSFGAWGENMLKYFERSKTALRERLVRDKMNPDQDQSWRFAKESVSLGICRASGLYMSNIRDGYVPKKKSDRTATGKTSTTTPTSEPPAHVTASANTPTTTTSTSMPLARVPASPSSVAYSTTTTTTSSVGSPSPSRRAHPPRPRRTRTAPLTGTSQTVVSTLPFLPVSRTRGTDPASIMRSTLFFSIC